MALTRQEKEAVVAEVADVASSAHSAVAAEYRGISVTDLTGLRSKARESGVYLRVVKNSLAKRAVEGCLLYTSPSPRDATLSRMPSSA